LFALVIARAVVTGVIVRVYGCEAEALNPLVTIRLKVYTPAASPVLDKAPVLGSIVTPGTGGLIEYRATVLPVVVIGDNAENADAAGLDPLVPTLVITSGA
jgi:hypothetical protein